MAAEDKKKAPEAAKDKVFKVKTEFRDKDNFDKVYKVGDTVKFDKDRMDDLVELDLIG